MNTFDANDVIDLTSSFILVNHCALISDTIIDLDTDDSIIEDNVTTEHSLSHSNTTNSTHQQRDGTSLTTRCNNNSYKNGNSRKKLNPKTQNVMLRESTNETESKYGSCPICWDGLGKKPLASTKCGHVYCVVCLEKSLSIEKRCPTCRTVLKGKNAYHPLYLPI